MMTDGQDVDFADLDFLLSPQNSCEASENANCNQSSLEQKTDGVCTQSPNKVDQLVKQMLQSATERQMLEQRLQEFQQRAETIRQMYENEKRLRQEYFQKHEETARNYASVDHDLVVKNLELEQLRAQCAEIKPPPFEYKLLVGRYIKLAQTLSEMRQLQCHDQTLLKKLQKYCQEKGIKIPVNKIPKSPRKKIASAETAEKEVQCDLVQQIIPVKQVHASTQYISTVSTRGTNTNIIRKCDVGLMHGSPLSETLPADLPTVDVMMHELLQYDISNRTFLSPLKDFINIPKPVTISTGTCTDVCNIKRDIDFVKPQVETKSAETQTTKTADNDSAINHGQKFDPQLFNKLWNTFGCMVYALMSDEKQRNQDVMLEEKFSDTMCFTKETLNSWLSQAAGLPSFPTNTQATAHFSTWNAQSYSDFKFNKSTQEFQKDKQGNQFLAESANFVNNADADIECMEMLSNEIIVLDSINNEDESKHASMVTTKERKRRKHLMKNNKLNKQTNALNKSGELQCEELNESSRSAGNEALEFIDSNYEINRIVLRSTNETQTEFADRSTAEQEAQTKTENANIPKFVHTINEEHLSDTNICVSNGVKAGSPKIGQEKEKRKNLQKNENETETKKRRLTCCDKVTNSTETFEAAEEIMESNCETPIEEILNEPTNLNSCATETKSMQTIEELENCANEETIELNCESPKLVIDYDEEEIAEESDESESINSVAQISCTSTADQNMIDECVQNMSVAFENNEFEKLRDSELQDVLIKIFGDEIDVSDVPFRSTSKENENNVDSVAAADNTECIIEIAEPDDINECQFNDLHVPKEIPLDLKVLPELNAYSKRRKNCLMHQLVRSYSATANKIIAGQVKKYRPCSELRANIIAYIKSKDISKDMDIETHVFKKSGHLKSTIKCKQIAKVIVQYVSDLTAQQEKLLDNKNMQAHILELISVMHRNAQIFKATLVTDLEKTIFNPVSKAEKMELHQILNLTALYLLIDKSFEVNPYSARLFIAKTLYYFNALASPIIYMVLCQYPTALPHREDRAHNPMDPLVNIIQHLLMSTKYDMNNKELQHRELLSKLRYEYHYEPFQPNRNSVLNIILSNLHAQRDLQKIPYALALLCKRLDPQLVVKDIIQLKLIPLINSWRALEEFSERLAVVLDCLSVLIKPFPLQMDVSVYLSIFEQFINSANKRLRESAVRAILRLQRFGYVNCFNSLLTLNTDTAKFQADTIAMLRTFIHRKPLNFWQNVCPDVVSV